MREVPLPPDSPRPKRSLLERVAGVARDPLGACDRVRDRLDWRREQALPKPQYRAEPDWERRLHEFIGVGFPCDAGDEFRNLWPRVEAVVIAKGVRFGPQSFYGYNDGDPEFCRALWCLVRHLRPANIVETGVAHGISTRIMLEALELNGHGRLVSIDPPPVDPDLAARVAAAVDGFAPERWRLCRGTSRRRLPRLLAELGKIDLFVHDSLHTTRNVSFEIGQVLRSLQRGGFVVIDDIDTNWGFGRLMRQFPAGRFMVGQSQPVRPDTRRFDDRGLFGVMQYQP